MFNRFPSFGSPDDILSVSHGDRGTGLPLELRELIQQQCLSTPSPSAAADSDWPVSIYVPERYEQNYAYPLIVWFHDDGGSDSEVEQMINSVSSQNYCGLGIQGNCRSQNDSSWEWNTSALDYSNVSLTDLLSVTVRGLRRGFHIHSERIFLAGTGKGADVALHQLVQTPHWFAGAVLLDPQCPLHIVEGIPAAHLQGSSVLWTVSRNAASEVLARNVQAIQLMRTAGTCPDVRLTDHRIDPESTEIRFLDHWLLSQIDAEAFV